MRAGNTLKAAAIGGVIAGVINVVLYYVGKAFGAEYVMTGGGEPESIPIVMPFAMSLLPALVGGGILVGLNKFAPQKAWAIFLGLSALTFILMIPGPIMQMGDDTAAIVALEVMHVVAVATVICVLNRFARGHT